MSTSKHGLPEGYFYGELSDDFGDIDHALSEEALALARQHIGVTRDMEVHQVVLDSEKNVVGVSLVSSEGGNLSFDVVVDEKDRNKGIGGALLETVTDPVPDCLETSPPVSLSADVVSEIMKKMLEKRGWVVSALTGDSRWSMCPLPEEISSTAAVCLNGSKYMVGEYLRSDNIGSFAVIQWDAGRALALSVGETEEKAVENFIQHAGVWHTVDTATGLDCFLHDAKQIVEAIAETDLKQNYDRSESVSLEKIEARYLWGGTLFDSPQEAFNAFKTDLENDSGFPSPSRCEAPLHSGRERFSKAVDVRLPE